ncbi:response regulator [Pelomyxa schiedti]|nr:response regulator [Pelomyxa schiedti]
MDDVELSMAEHEVEMVAVGAAVLADAAPPSPTPTHSKRSKLLLTQHTFVFSSLSYPGHLQLRLQIILEGVCLIAIAVGQPYLVPAWNPSKDIVALTVNDVIALGSSAVVFFSVTLLLTAVNVRSTAVGCVCVALAIGILEVALWNAQLCDIVPFAFFIIAGASLWSMQAYQLRELDYVSKTCLQFEQRKLEEEQQRNMDLLHMILPPEIAEKLKSCMGRDNLATNHPMERFHIEKIKTIGTAIMAAVGIPRANCDDATRAALFALHVQHIATLFAQQRGLDISVKVGIASGSVTSGVIAGFEKPKFDIFGDTVNTSARMMQTCPRGSIQLTDFTVHQLSGGLKLAKSPTPVFVKGKGDMVTYFLLGSEGDVHLQVSRENMSQDSILTPSYPKALLKTNNKLISESDFTTLEHVRLQPLPSLNRILLRFSNIEAEFLHNYFTVFFVTLRPHMLVLGVCTATSVLVSYLVGCFSINYAMLAETPTLIIVLLCFTPLLTRFPCQVHYSIFVICISTSLAWLVVYSLGWTNDAWPLMVIGHLAVLHSFCRVLFRFVTCASIIIAPVAIICGIVIDDWPWGRILVSMITILLALAYGHYATEKAMRINFGLEKLFAEKKQLLLEEQEASNQLLLSILPPQILQELTASEETDEVIAETVSSGSLLMADIVGFTTICDSIPAHTVVTMLDTLFRELDSSIAGLIASGVQKLKTIGDAYVVGANLPFCPCVDHATKLTQVAQAMVRAIATVNRDHRKGLLENLPEIRMRIGVHSGPVLAGVIRMKSLSFDCWGPSVYIADALQTSGAANQIHISDSVKELLDDRLFSCTPAPDMPYGDSVYKTYFVAG